MAHRRSFPPDALDAVGLAAIVLLSAWPYLSGLGFYSDDWAFLAGFAEKVGEVPFDFIASGVEHPFEARPGHGIYLALLFQLFQFDPLAYHLVNTSVIAISCVALWRLVLDLGVSRRSAFAIAAIFALLPQLSTVRVWYAAFQVPLSLLFFLGSCLCELRAARDGSAVWKVLSLGALIVSLSLYELFAPLFIAAAAIATAIRGKRRGANDFGSWLRAAIPQLSNVVITVGALLLKAAVSDRVIRSDTPIATAKYIVHEFLRLDYDWRVDYGLNAKAGLVVNFWHTIALPFRSLTRLPASDIWFEALFAGLLIAAIVFWRLRSGGPSVAGARSSLLLVATGFAVFCLGYAVFLASGHLSFSPAGIGNRTAVAAALGIAAIIVGLAHLAARATPSRVQAQVFAAILAMVAALGSVAMSEIGHHWVVAYAKQQAILRSARSDLADVMPNTTIILDGVCPYDGPGIAFETSWDVAGALTVALGKPVSGDVVSPRMTVTDSGLATSMYNAPTLYAYGPRLLVYNPQRHSVVRLESAADARRYFAQPNRFEAPCPTGFVAHGVPI
jgi:hypothetical protein